MKALIALDDSKHATQTLRAVGGWATTWAVEVHLLTVLSPGEVRDTVAAHDYTHALTPAGMPSGHALHTAEPLPVLAEDRTQAFDRIERETEEHLGTLAEKFMPGVPIKAHAVVAEDVTAAVLKAAAGVSADLIVVGTHGRTGLSHMIVGSVAEAIIRQAPIPVLVVGPRVREMEPA